MADTNDRTGDQGGGSSDEEALGNEPNRTASKAEGDRATVEQDIEEKERKGEI
jgi:hypothetical protein